jgi:lipoate-protein ligase B
MIRGGFARRVPGNLPPSPCFRLDLASIPYGAALDLQHRLVDLRRQERLCQDLVLFLEHPPVFTLGRRGGREYIRVPGEALAAAGIQVVQTERGGFITYHGPGQLVAYLILDLRRRRLGVDALVTALEDAMIATAADFGVGAGRHPRNRGVWTGERKLGSIGLAVRHGISFHGLALNVTTDLTPFGWILPCGLAEVAMTSLQAAGTRPVNLPAAREALATHLGRALALAWTPMGAEALAEMMADSGNAPGGAPEALSRRNPVG